MRKVGTVLTLAAASAIGWCGFAAAQTPQTHVLTVRLPGGGVEQIYYTGSVAPQVFVTPAPAAVEYLPMSALFGAASPFAELDRVSAAMDRQAAQMLRAAAALAAAPAQLDATAASALPAGGREYSFVATSSGNGVCTQSVEITSEGNGPPRVVRHTSGNCAALPQLRVPTEQPAQPIPSNGPRMIMTKATGTAPAAGRIEEAALR